MLSRRGNIHKPVLNESYGGCSAQTAVCLCVCVCALQCVCVCVCVLITHAGYLIFYWTLLTYNSLKANVEVLKNVP